jgi:hypothetical protein
MQQLSPSASGIIRAGSVFVDTDSDDDLPGEHQPPGAGPIPVRDPLEQLGVGIVEVGVLDLGEGRPSRRRDSIPVRWGSGRARPAAKLAGPERLRPSTCDYPRAFRFGVGLCGFSLATPVNPWTAEATP